MVDSFMVRHVRARAPWTTGWPARGQAPVPPATDQASMPASARKSAAARLRLPLAQITYTGTPRGSSATRRRQPAQRHQVRRRARDRPRTRTAPARRSPPRRLDERPRTRSGQPHASANTSLSIPPGVSSLAHDSAVGRRIVNHRPDRRGLSARSVQLPPWVPSERERGTGVGSRAGRRGRPGAARAGAPLPGTGRPRRAHDRLRRGGDRCARRRRGRPRGARPGAAGRRRRSRCWPPRPGRPRRTRWSC